jgi:ATP-binding cassette subfamily C protein/ATP-binding cassette subfamily C protein EexD
MFSGVVNLLQLTTSIYMMQVFDRVLPTRVLDTLLYLSLLAGAAVLVFALLEAVRGPVMQRLATWRHHRRVPAPNPAGVAPADAGGLDRPP